MIIAVVIPLSEQQWRVRLCNEDRISDKVCTIDANGVEHIDLCWKTGKNIDCGLVNKPIK